MTPTSNSPGINPVGAALDAAVEKAAAEGRTAHIEVEATILEKDGQPIDPAPPAAPNVKMKKPGVAARAFIGATGAVEHAKETFRFAVSGMWKAVKIGAFAAAFIGCILTVLYFTNVETKQQLKLHGGLHDAGFFSNVAFKLDTGKTTTIHQRGQKVEAVTMRDSKNRLYTQYKDGWKKLGN